MPIVSDSIVTVDLNPFLGNKMFDFGDLVKNVSIVPLETTDKSLISNIYKIIVSEIIFMYLMISRVGELPFFA